jgi:hypothetical protein
MGYKNPPRKMPRLLIHQDGDKLHWTPQCMAVMEKYNLQPLAEKDEQATYSPDLNIIEPCFRDADLDAKELQKQGVAPDVHATVERWKGCFRDLQTRTRKKTTPTGPAGETYNAINAHADRYLQTVQDVLKAKGAATRW